MTAPKQILYIDLDNTLVDFRSALPRLDPPLPRDSQQPHLDDTPGIFALMDPMPGAIEAFHALAAVYDVYILSTSPWKNPSAWSDKLEWVHRHLGSDAGTPAYKRLILSHHKHLNRGDFLIDDRPNNGAAEFEGEWLQFGSDVYPDWAAVLRRLIPAEAGAETPSTTTHPPEETVVAAVAALTHRGERLEALRTSVPDVAGLYAFHADASAWAQLGLATGAESDPLYVGKAERSLRSRDVRTHFETGKTGSSTVRRSFAALLRDQLALRAMPRNPKNPGHFASFGLEPDSDERLSAWMSANLTLAWWPLPAGEVLRPLEVAVIGRLQPPLNLTDVSTPSPLVKRARARMAREAEAWVPSALDLAP